MTAFARMSWELPSPVVRRFTFYKKEVISKKAEIKSNFKNKMNNFIEKLGFDYIDKIENDISLLEELL